MAGEGIQKPTEYTPTTAEKKLLEALLNPENARKTISDICQIADVSRDTYYSAFKKPEFEALVKRESINLVAKNVAPVVNTFIREALKGSFQHGKVVLEMADLYTEKNKQELDVKGNINVLFNIPRPPNE